MGKGSRNKKARAQGRNQAPFATVQEAVIAVGDVFGTEPNCADASALLAGTLRLLGYDPTVRPVDVGARDAVTNTNVSMGSKATALLTPEQAAELEDLRPNGQDTGHVVLTIEEPDTWLLDANLRQLAHYGIAAPNGMFKISSVHPENGQWGAYSYEGLRWFYLLHDDNRILVHDFEAKIAKWKPHAERLARELRAGVTAEQLRANLIPRHLRNAP